MEAGRAFQILAVRIRNEDAKRFVRVSGISTTQILTVPRGSMVKRTSLLKCTIYALFAPTPEHPLDWILQLRDGILEDLSVVK
ncbi:jg14532 [Pararge aegeria aegeria]|uniref:Jg14532 protein n=1 Tax=Pararge aegeria aegeria TaxID=348720 RepID=A0A8S4RZ39_9NEOP|nr:jg14532 [Pararge aegeria aegeria]